MSIVLGIDLATAEVRLQAVDVDSGEELVQLRRKLAVVEAGDTRTQRPNYGEWSRALIGAATAHLGPRAHEIRAVSITGTSGTVVPVDASGTPVGDAVLYNDPRGGDQLRALANAGLDQRPSGALARAAWMHAARGHADSGAVRYVFTPDVVAAALAGRLLPSDTSHALKSGIDPVARTWNLAALAMLGLPEECLPSLVPPGSIVGEVANPAALGLPEGVAIVSGMTDGSTGQLATGAVAEGDTVGVLGTTLVVKGVARRDIVDNAAGIYSHVAPDGLFWPGGASNTGAGALRAGVTAARDPLELAAQIRALGPTATVAYPLARPGERFPISSSDFAGFSVGLDGAHREDQDPVARFRTLYEGVAFVERLGIERLTTLGVEQRHHHVAGGTSASAVWNEIRATALGRPVVVAPGAGSARGAAVIAASVLGEQPLATIAVRFAGRRSVVDPVPAMIEQLDERYRVFLAALESRTPRASR